MANNNLSSTALVTGASSGIGKALAEELAKQQHNLVIVARREALLNALAEQLSREYGVKVEVIVQDLAEPNAADKLFSALSQRGLQIDILVNNAGFGMKGRLDEIEPRLNQAMMMVNMVVLTELAQRLIPQMIERGRGRILNIASTSAYQPGPYMAVYFASKAYVLSFSEALSRELKGTGVTATALCPGPTATAFSDAADLKNSPIHNGTVPMMTAEQVAKKGYQAMMGGKRVYIPGFFNYISSHISRIMPNKWVMNVLANLHQR